MTLCGDHLSVVGIVGSLLLGLALGMVLAAVAAWYGGYLGRRAVERKRAWDDRYGPYDPARAVARTYDPDMKAWIEPYDPAEDE